MKKNFCKLMALVVVALMMMSTMAFATPSDPAVDADDLAATTVTLTGLPENEEATVLVVKAGTDLAKLANTDIIFIDQLTIDGDGNVSFPMDISAAADATNNEVDKVDVYCGYTSMSGNALAALGVAVEEEVTGPEFDLAKSEIKTGNFGKDGYVRAFIKIAEPGAWTLTHSDADSEIYYSTERKGYDCMLKTAASTIEDVIKEISGVKEVPSAEITIAMYGDVNGDAGITVGDTAQIKKSLQGSITFNIKSLMTADVNGDSGVTVGDTAQIKKRLQNSSYIFPIIPVE